MWYPNAQRCVLDADIMSEGFGLEKVEVFAHFPRYNHVILSSK